MHSGLPSLTSPWLFPDEPVDPDDLVADAAFNVLFVLSTARMKN
jgi:hypothetical protein